MNGEPAPVLKWFRSWDGLMHAFPREQAAAELAVVAICGHISRTSSVTRDQASQCHGCLVVLGQNLAGAAWQ